MKDAAHIRCHDPRPPGLTPAEASSPREEIWRAPRLPGTTRRAHAAEEAAYHFAEFTRQPRWSQAGFDSRPGHAGRRSAAAADAFCAGLSTFNGARPRGAIPGPLRAVHLRRDHDP